MLHHIKIGNQTTTDSNAFFNMATLPVIIDEVQKVPELLSKIQVLADNSKTKGQFILTGRFQQILKTAIAQSLAGRTAVLNLSPFQLVRLIRWAWSFHKMIFYIVVLCQNIQNINLLIYCIVHIKYLTMKDIEFAIFTHVFIFATIFQSNFILRWAGEYS